MYNDKNSDIPFESLSSIHLMSHQFLQVSYWHHASWKILGSLLFRCFLQSQGIITAAIDIVVPAMAINVIEVFFDGIGSFVCLCPLKNAKHGRCMRARSTSSHAEVSDGLPTYEIDQVSRK